MSNKCCDYCPIGINLLHSSKNEKYNKTFDILLYKGFLNKINIFINNCLSKSFFFEYFYLDVYNKLENPVNLSPFKNKIKKNFEADIYNSINRKRVNIMNVPKNLN